MNLQQLRNVQVLSKTLNFTKAADIVHIVQPAFSRQVKQLEDEIGAKLFDRNKRNVKLTQAGHYYIKETSKIIAQLDRVAIKAAQIHKGEAGEIKIGYTHSSMQIILPDILKAIKSRFPNLKMRLKEMNNKDHYPALLQGDLDFGIGTNPIVPSNLKSKVIFEDNFAVILPKNHLIDEKNFEDLSVFSKEEFILPSASSAPEHIRKIETICSKAGFKPQVVHETDFAVASFKLIEMGMGISIEPVSSLKGQNFNIRAIDLPNISEKVEYVLMWHPNREKEHAKLFDLLLNEV